MHSFPTRDPLVFFYGAASDGLYTTGQVVAQGADGLWGPVELPNREPGFVARVVSDCTVASNGDPIELAAGFCGLPNDLVNPVTQAHIDAGLDLRVTSSGTVTCVGAGVDTGGAPLSLFTDPGGEVLVQAFIGPPGARL